MNPYKHTEYTLYFWSRLTRNFLSLQKPAISSRSLLFCMCSPFSLGSCLLALFVTLPLKIFTSLSFLCYPVPGQTLNPTPSLQHWAASNSTEALVLTAQFFFPLWTRKLIWRFPEMRHFPLFSHGWFHGFVKSRGKCHWVPFPGSTPVRVWPPSCCRWAWVLILDEVTGHLLNVPYYPLGGLAAKRMIKQVLSLGDIRLPADDATGFVLWLNWWS